MRAQAFHGDLFIGTGYVMRLFKEETAAVLAEVHMENQLLFCVYIFQVLLSQRVRARG